jgi:hypothetical protein
MVCLALCGPSPTILPRSANAATSWNAAVACVSVLKSEAGEPSLARCWSGCRRIRAGQGGANGRSRQPELFAPVAKELVELYLAAGRPDPFALVFGDSEGGYHRRQNWRRRVWIPGLERAGIAYFRTYDLRHTCATLLIYEGRTVNEVADHLGHADPGFTARAYAHVMRDAPKQRRVSMSRAIAAACRPLVDPSASESGISTAETDGKPLQIKEADARTRPADPFITSVDQVSPRVAPGRAEPRGSRKTPTPRWRPKTSNDTGVDPA